jgi:hypothetical protein
MGTFRPCTIDYVPTRILVPFMIAEKDGASSGSAT